MGVFSDLLSSYGAYKSAPKVAEAQRAGLAQAGELQEQAYQDVTGMYDPYQQAGQQSMAQLMSGLQSGEFTPEMGEFSYDRGVNEFLDPNVDYQTQQANQALEQSAAMGGQLRSGATLQGLQEQAQSFANQAYQQAYQNMMQDKSFAYNQFINQFNAQSQNAMNRQQALQGLMSQGLGATGAVANARMGYGGQQSQNAMQMADIKAQRDATRMMSGAQMAGTLGDVGLAVGMQAAGSPSMGGGMPQVMGQTPMNSPQMVQPMQGQGNITGGQATMMGFNPNLNNPNMGGF